MGVSVRLSKNVRMYLPFWVAIPAYMIAGMIWLAILTAWAVAWLLAVIVKPAARLLAVTGKAAALRIDQAPDRRQARQARKRAAGEHLGQAGPPLPTAHSPVQAAERSTGKMIKPVPAVRRPGYYLAWLISSLVVFIGAWIGINQAPARSGLSYAMGWTIGLRLARPLLSPVPFFP